MTYQDNGFQLLVQQIQQRFDHKKIHVSLAMHSESSLDSFQVIGILCYISYPKRLNRPAERGEAEEVTVRGPGDTGGPGVQHCQI